MPPVYPFLPTGPAEELGPGEALQEGPVPGPGQAGGDDRPVRLERRADRQAECQRPEAVVALAARAHQAAAVGADAAPGRTVPLRRPPARNRRGAPARRGRRAGIAYGTPLSFPRLRGAARELPAITGVYEPTFGRPRGPGAADGGRHGGRVPRPRTRPGVPTPGHPRLLRPGEVALGPGPGGRRGPRPPSPRCARPSEKGGHDRLRPRQRPAPDGAWAASVRRAGARGAAGFRRCTGPASSSAATGGEGPRGPRP
jgi:hypothetical protein